ncbi:MAG: ARPP-1 family domain-containing protein, partial [Hyphomicrobiaceae bacterium]
MSLTTYLLLLSGAAVPFAASFAGVAGANERLRISAPVVHENLTIYFVHGPSASGPVPLTLKEALLKGNFDVHETGSVTQLFVENRSDEEVFIQAGDIVKGGRQDRVLTISLVLPPKSG